MMLKDLERILYFENFVVTEPGLTALSEFQLLSEEEYMLAIEEYGEDTFTAMIGAEAIHEILSSLRPLSRLPYNCVPIWQKPVPS